MKREDSNDRHSTSAVAARTSGAPNDTLPIPSMVWGDALEAGELELAGQQLRELENLLLAPDLISSRTIMMTPARAQRPMVGPGCLCKG